MRRPALFSLALLLLSGCAVDRRGGGAAVSDCSEEPCDEGELNACADGEMSMKACARCGSVNTVCQDGSFVETGPCVGQGECEAHLSEEDSCGRVRICEATCVWGDWTGEAPCSEGERDSEACGGCGVRERFCDAGCQWGPWSDCQLGGECTPGEGEEQSCGSSEVGACQLGFQTRQCGEDCVFEEWSACQGAVEPANEICGDGIDQDCDGEDWRVPDAYEPNDDCASAFYAGDHPTPGDPAELNFTLHHDGDRDYFKFDFFDNPRSASQYIFVSGIWLPQDTRFQLRLYRSLDDCERGNAYAVGDEGSTASWLDNEDDESATGTWYVRVDRPGQPWCEASMLAIRIQASR